MSLALPDDFPQFPVLYGIEVQNRLLVGPRVDVRCKWSNLHFPRLPHVLASRKRVCVFTIPSCSLRDYFPRYLFEIDPIPFQFPPTHLLPVVRAGWSPIRRPLHSTSPPSAKNAKPKVPANDDLGPGTNPKKRLAVVDAPPLPITANARGWWRRRSWRNLCWCVR